MSTLSDRFKTLNGPGSSTDTRVPVFDGTGGTTIKESLATIDSNGSVNIPSGQTYKINGSAHTHAYATEADVIALAIALGG